jgi:hypothetical protein
MSLLTGFTHQTATLERNAGTLDDFGDTVFEDPVTIKVRRERKQQRITSATGAERISTTYILTEELVNTGDRVDGEVVQAVEDIINKAGKFLGTECYL